VSGESSSRHDPGGGESRPVGCGILEETRRRIVAHGSDLRRSRGERACVVAHRDE
jgi:hypothetical protein